MLWWVQSQLTAVPFLLFWDRSQTWCWAHSGMALLKVTNNPRCMWLAFVCHASSGEELWAKHTDEHKDYSPSWVQACFSESQLGKRLGLLGIGNRSLLFIDQAIAASLFLGLTWISLSSATFRAQWSGLHNPLSFPSLGEGYYQKYQEVPAASPLASLIKQTLTVIMSLQKRTVVLEPGSWPQRCGKQDSPSPNTMEHRGKEIQLKSFCQNLKASVLPAQVTVVTHGKLLIHRKCFPKASKTVVKPALLKSLVTVNSLKKHFLPRNSDEI